ncbi:MAG: hypothetical protein JST89_22290 [Cyanobacteria bacterium SZAS-4]|nr:hypothetical protein [Cyanobacteria bacterium SZAS-4]
MSTSARKRQIIKAIKDLDNRVTVADVVATTGLSLNEVTEELNSVAAQSQATLDVTNVGEVFYNFPQNFAVAYYAQGAKRVLLTVWNTIFKALFFLFRISFGVTLLLSFLFIFGSILLVQTVIAAGMGASQDVGGMWSDFANLLKRIAMQDIVLWKRQDNFDADPQQNGKSRQGFLLDCYSFLFGEGNPNEHLAEDRWKLLAQVIRLNEGIIIAEHLPPYTGRPAEDEPALFKVLSKFSGFPRLSESGQLIYVFPNMQQRSTNTSYTFMPEYIEEKFWQFSKMSQQTLRPVLALAIGNFLGSLFFWWLCLYTHRVSKPPALFLFFAIYGTMFVLVPLIRLVVIKFLNWRIAKRNEVTRGFENLIGSPDLEVRSKLEDAEKIRRDFGANPGNNVVYTTQKDYLEQLTDNL